MKEKFAEIKIIGISARTSNVQEMNPDVAKIGATLQKFFANNMQDQIPERKNPGRVFSIYTQYESDEHGEYTYFLGEEVNSHKNIPEGFEALTIPTQTYKKLTSSTGKMPTIVIDLWKKIWQMDEASLEGKRSYVSDFEIYDEKSHDPENATVDIYIGINDQNKS
jgi:predicted transcriptional regulator YdeE